MSDLTPEEEKIIEERLEKMRNREKRSKTLDEVFKQLDLD